MTDEQLKAIKDRVKQGAGTPSDVRDLVMEITRLRSEVAALKTRVAKAPKKPKPPKKSK